jgi:hypothetical protein
MPDRLLDKVEAGTIQTENLDWRTLRMPAANIVQEPSTELHCPSCGDHLIPGKCADPWAICLVCIRDHRFFIMPPAPRAASTATAADMSFPEISSLSPPAIASFWLSDPSARWVLNEQLAQLLRAIAESRRVLDEPRFSFCPICGQALAEYERPYDYYLQGLRCQSDHRWALRGGCLSSAAETLRLELQAEYSDAIVSQLIAAWLKPNPHLEPNLHDSIRQVLLSSPLCPQGAIRRND